MISTWTTYTPVLKKAYSNFIDKAYGDALLVSNEKLYSLPGKSYYKWFKGVYENANEINNLDLSNMFEQSEAYRRLTANGIMKTDVTSNIVVRQASAQRLVERTARAERQVAFDFYVESVKNTSIISSTLEQDGRIISKYANGDILEIWPDGTKLTIRPYRPPVSKYDVLNVRSNVMAKKIVQDGKYVETYCRHGKIYVHNVEDGSLIVTFDDFMGVQKVYPEIGYENFVKKFYKDGSPKIYDGKPTASISLLESDNPIGFSGELEDFSLSFLVDEDARLIGMQTDIYGTQYRFYSNRTEIVIYKDGEVTKLYPSGDRIFIDRNGNMLLVEKNGNVSIGVYGKQAKKFVRHTRYEPYTFEKLGSVVREDPNLGTIYEHGRKYVDAYGNDVYEWLDKSTSTIEEDGTFVTLYNDRKLSSVYNDGTVEYLWTDGSKTTCRPGVGEPVVTDYAKHNVKITEYASDSETGVLDVTVEIPDQQFKIAFSEEMEVTEISRSGVITKEYASGMIVDIYEDYVVTTHVNGSKTRVVRNGSMEIFEKDATTGEEVWRLVREDDPLPQNLVRTYENPRTGTITRTYEGDLKIKEFKNGLHLEERANGDIFKRYPNGNTELRAKVDNSVFTKYKDGESILMQQDGRYFRELPDGTTIRKYGRLRGQTDGSVVMTVKDGHSVKWTADGKVFEKKLYSNGNRALNWTEIQTEVRTAPKLRKSARLSFGERPAHINPESLKLPGIQARGGGKFVNPSISKATIEAAQLEKSLARVAVGIRSFCSFLVEQVLFTMVTEFLFTVYDWINPDEAAVIDDFRPSMANMINRGYKGEPGRGVAIDGTETAVQRVEASYSGLSMFTSSKDFYYELNPKYKVDKAYWDKSVMKPEDFVLAVRGYTASDWEHANLGVKHPAINTPFASDEYKALRARDQYLIGLNDYSMANSQMDQIWMPKEITRIGSYTFANANINLLSFEKDSRLARIGEYAFSRSSFESLDFMCNFHLLRMEYGAFSNMPNLKVLLLPESVVYLGNDLVKNTPNLDTIYVSWTEPYQLQLLKDNLQNYSNDVPTTDSTAFKAALAVYDVAKTAYVKAMAAYVMAGFKSDSNPTEENILAFTKAEKAFDEAVAVKDAAAVVVAAAIPHDKDIFRGKKICIPPGSYSVYKTMFPGKNGMFGGNFDLDMNMPFTIVSVDRETMQIKEMLDDEDYSPRLKELVDLIHGAKIDIAKNNKDYRDEGHNLVCNDDKRKYYQETIKYLQSEISNLEREVTFYEEYTGLKRPDEEPFGMGSLHSSDLVYINKDYGHENIFFNRERKVFDYNPNDLYLSLNEELQTATILQDSVYDSLEKLVIPYSVNFRGKEYSVIPLTIEYIPGLDEDGDGEDDAALTLALDYHEAVDVDIDNEYIVGGHFANLPYLNSVTFGPHTKFIGSELGDQVREFHLFDTEPYVLTFVSDSAFPSGSKVYAYWALVSVLKYKKIYDAEVEQWRYWTPSGAEIIWYEDTGLKSADSDPGYGFEELKQSGEPEEMVVTPSHAIDIKNGIIYNKEEYLTTVFDMAGRMRISSRAREINLAVLPEGNYLVVSNKRRVKIHL